MTDLEAQQRQRKAELQRQRRARQKVEFAGVPLDYRDPARRLEEFKSKIRVTETGCWRWLGRVIPSGYGQIYHKGRWYVAHRVFFVAVKGLPQVGLDLDHLCRNRACVNPERLEAVTRSENNRRGHDHNSAKTHCPSGHEYTPENTRLYGGRRYCRACSRVASKDYHHRVRKPSLKQEAGA